MNFKSKVLEPLKKVILNIHLQDNKHENEEQKGSPSFKFQFNMKKAELNDPFGEELKRQSESRRMTDDRGFSLRDFINQMSSEKQYTPPIRVVFAGDDKTFN